jgi:hypothetical protein
MANTKHDSMEKQPGWADKANRWLFVFFSLGWSLLLLLSYWAYHPYYTLSLGGFPNLGLAAALLGCCGLAGFWLHRGRGKRRVNGLMLYGFVLLMQLVAMGVSSSRYGIPRGEWAERLGYMLGFSLYLHGAFFLVVVLHVVVGQAVVRHLGTWYSRDSLKVLSLAVGLSIVGLALVLLGFVGLLHTWVLWLLAVALLAWQRQAAWSFVRDLLWKPLRGAQGGGLEAIPVLLILAATALANIAVIKAFPLGFDGAGLYLNTAHLIAEYHALPQGGQAFNWSVFMSLGELLFGLEAVSILFSHFSIFFVLFALYRISRLFFKRGLSWLVVLAFYLNPALSYHLLHDEKVDLGFLFITLSIFLLLLEYPLRLAGKKALPEKQALFQFGRFALREDTLIWALAGWLAGYALGIKYIGLLTTYAVAVYAFYSKVGTRAAAGALGLLAASVFVLGIYRYGYLDLAGVHPLVFSALAAVPGLALLAWGLHGRWGLLKPVVRLLAIFGSFMALAFSPWAGKNLYENGQLSLRAIAEGASPAPEIVVGWKEVDGASLLGQIVQVLQAQRIALSEEQLQRSSAIIAKYDFKGKTPAEQRADTFKARDEIIAKVMTPTQQAIITGKAVLPAPDASLPPEVSDEERAYQLMLKSLSRKGVELEAAQRQALRGLFAGLEFKSLSTEERKRKVAQLREATASHILTPAQRTVMEGMGATDTTLEGVVLSGGQREEIKRYIGYEQGLPLYLSLPYDLTINTNVLLLKFVDIGFWYLLILVVLLYSRRLWRNLLLLAALSLLWAFSVYSLYAVYNLPVESAVRGSIGQLMANHQGIWAAPLGAVFAAVQLFFLRLGLFLHGVYDWLASWPFRTVFGFLLAAAALFYALLRERLAAMSGHFKGMLSLAFSFAFFWVLLGNAIPWYAFPVLALLLVFFAYFLRHPDRLASPALTGYSRYWLWSTLGLYLLLCFSLRFINTLQPKGSEQLLFQKPFIQFATEYQGKEQIYASFIPMMGETIRAVNADLEGKVYRVGTFFNYHIRYNDQRVLEDNQLERYAQISAALERKEEFLEVLKENGFRYVLFDLKTGTIDRTPEQSLRRKAQEFLGILLQSGQARLLSSDNLVEDPGGSSVRIGSSLVQAKPGFGERVIYQGTYALFEL